MPHHEIPLGPIRELAAEIGYDTDRVRRPSYGRYLEEFEEGAVFRHPRGLTVTEALIQEYTHTFMEANPLYLNAELARAHGHPTIPAPPLLVFNVALSLGVQNNSEKAIANLGYYDMHFLRPVYAGDTLTAASKVLSRRERGPDKPGIVHVHTLATDQHGRCVLSYERKILIPPSGRPAAARGGNDDVEFDAPTSPTAQLPTAPGAWPSGLSRSDSYFEDFEVGDVIVHPNGRTITDEHTPWTYRVGNTHPLHFDRVYCESITGPLSGQPIVYGGLVFGWLAGLASRDVTDNALTDLGYTEGYHTQPAVSGDTVYAISRVLSKDEVDSADAGVVQMQLIGVKNVTGAAAIETHGAELFEKENGKKKAGKEKIAAKIFEIERRVLIKKRP